MNGEFSNFSHSGYINNFRGTGEPGLLLHGDTFTLCDEIIINGIPQVKFFDNMVDIVEHIFQKYDIDLIAATQGKKLHLVACHATGSTGTAQRMANVIRAPVVSYGPPGSKIFSASIGELMWATPYNKVKIINSYGLRVNAKPYIHYPIIL